MDHADRFRLPILTFIDTPGAYAGLEAEEQGQGCLLYTSPSPRDKRQSRMPSSA